METSVPASSFCKVVAADAARGLGGRAGGNRKIRGIDEPSTAESHRSRGGDLGIVRDYYMRRTRVDGPAIACTRRAGIERAADIHGSGAHAPNNVIVPS